MKKIFTFCVLSFIITGNAFAQMKAKAQCHSLTVEGDRESFFITGNGNLKTLILETRTEASGVTTRKTLLKNLICERQGGGDSMETYICFHNKTADKIFMVKEENRDYLALVVVTPELTKAVKDAGLTITEGEFGPSIVRQYYGHFPNECTFTK